MSELAEFFFRDSARVVLLDCLEISHPNFSQTYRIVRNAPNGLAATHDGEPVTNWVFDGVDDEIDFGDVLDMARNTARSVFAFYSTTKTAGQTILAKQAASGNAGFRFVISSANDDLILGGPSGTQQIQCGPTVRPPRDGTEHCFGFTYDGSSDAAGVSFYVDGAFVAKTVDQDNLTSADTTNSEPLQIGLRGSTAALEGTLRHITVWNRKLTALEVSQVYNGGEPPDVDSLSFSGDCILWIKLDADDTADPGGVIDHGPNGFDGTANFDPTITEEFEFDYEYYPARVLPVASDGDMVQALSITLGDVGDVIAAEISNLWEANGLGTRPTVTYRGYRSDDLSVPIRGPITLEIQSVTVGAEGSTFEARAPELNASRTGELYTLERFPMLKGFMS